MGENPVIAVEVWSLPACPRCVEAKSRLRAAGVEVVERSIEDVRQAKVRDIDVLTQTTMQSTAPVMRVVRADGKRRDEFIEPGDLEAWLNGDSGEL